MSENEALEYMRLFRDEWDRNSKTKNAKALDIAIQSLEEIQQYRAIGTVEELQDLKEKSVAKKAKYDNEDGWETYICPSCGKVVGEHQNYCWNCGQAFET